MSAEPPREVTFVLASCQYPAGILDGHVAQASFRRLARRLRHPASRATPKRLLLVGDSIYVDATAGLFDPTAEYDRYVRRYEDFLRTPAYRDVAAELQPLVMLDDHEIEDNWEPGVGAQTSLDEGRAFYLAYQRGFAPAAKPGEPLWFTFEIDGFPFFMADTRTERGARTAEAIEQARIMSEEQFGALTAWLDSHAELDLPKFIASPAIFLPRRLRATHRNHPASALRSDAWDGYPRSLHRLLAHIARRGIRNVVFLSGDEHLSCVARATVRSAKSEDATLIHSVHSSPLYGPFPFANSVPEDLAGNESFAFAQEKERYGCSVETEFAAPGDGYAVIRALRDARSAKWKICCRFDRDPRIHTAPRRIDRLLA